MSALTDLAQMLKNEKKSTGSDYTATVTRVDGGTAYVRITGSDIMDTPVTMSIDCKAGDNVRVRVANGKAWITGNDTAPPTYDKENLQKIEAKNKAMTSDIHGINQWIDKVGTIITGSGLITANLNGSWKNTGATIKLNPGVYILFAMGESLLVLPNNIVGVMISNYSTYPNGIADKTQCCQRESSAFDEHNKVLLSLPYKVEKETTLYGFVKNGNVSTQHRCILQAIRIA